jgi:hypothetical protein
MTNLFTSWNSCRRALLVGTAVLTASCSDPSGVDPGQDAPVISVSARAAQEYSIPPALEPSTLQALVRREGEERVVADTTLAVVPGQQLALELRVPMRGEDEVFEVELIILNDGETEVFRSEPTLVPAHEAGAPVEPTEVLLEYSGPGSGADRLQVTPDPSSVLVGGQTSLEAIAFDDDDPLGAVPVEWRSLNPEVVALADAATGLFQAGDQRGSARIVASLDPLGLADTARIFVTPPPGRIVRAGGDNQEGRAGGALPNPIRVRVLATDGINLPGQLVVFEAGSGGSVSPATAVTGADGTASAEWTLGPVLGPQELVARVASDPELAITFRAEAGAAALASVTLAPRFMQFDALTETQALAVLAVDIFGNVVTPDDVSWSSSNTDVVTISGEGVVTARGNGEAEITATADGVRSEPTRAVVAQAPVSVQLTPGAGWLIALSQERRFAATARDRLDQPIPDASFEWSSSNPGVLEIDGNGLARGVGLGSAEVRARLTGSELTARSAGQVGVGPLETLIVAPGGITFDALTLTEELSVEGRDAFGNVVELDEVTWVSSRPEVASVSESGVVTAVGLGDTEIRARVGDVTSGPVRVVVDPVAVGARIEPSSGWVLRDGRRLTFEATAFDRLGNDLPHVEFTYESSDEDVLTIDEDSGRARARNEGVVTVRATMRGNDDVRAASTGIVVD